MTATGASRSYQNKPKDHWRRRLWNEVLRRTKKREQDELVLYLAGPEDNDRQIAVSKGVPNENLIAVDLDEGNVKRVRERGGYAIQGDVIDVLWSWPKAVPVSAVLLDYCSGIERRNSGSCDVFSREVLENAVVAINFLRGRDPWSNPIRKSLDGFGLMEPIKRVDVETGRTLGYLCRNPKNRAYQFLAWECLQLVVSTPRWGAALCGLGEALEGVSDRIPFAIEVPAEDVPAVCEEALANLGQMKPQFFSYRSGVLRFDPCVFKPCPWGGMEASDWPTGAAEILQEEAEWVRHRERLRRCKRTSRRIAATLATRTRRLRAA